MFDFRTPVLPPTVSKSIRFPDTMVDSIEKEITGTGCTFSAFVVEAVRAALKSLEDQRKEQNKNE